VQTNRPVPFEVYCERCRVSFPIGARRCIHCGGPTAASRSNRSLRHAPVAEPEPVPVEGELEPEAVQRRFLSPTTLVWIVLIAAGYFYRACGGEAP
jgi:hypothetical protein